MLEGDKRCSSKHLYLLTLEGTKFEHLTVLQWLDEFGERVSLEEQYALAHKKTKKWPLSKVLVACGMPAIPKDKGWVVLTQDSFRGLWLTFRRRSGFLVGAWFYVDRFTLLPFTDAPVF